MGKSSTSKNVLLFHSTYFQTNPYHQALAKNWRSLITADHCQRTIARHCFWAKLWNVSVNELFQEYSYTVGVWIHYHWPIKICWNAAATFTCPLKLGLTHKHSESPEYSEDPRARSAAAMPWPVAGPQPAQDFCEVVYAHTIISISRNMYTYIYMCVCACKWLTNAYVRNVFVHVYVVRCHYTYIYMCVCVYNIHIYICDIWYMIYEIWYMIYDRW